MSISVALVCGSRSITRTRLPIKAENVSASATVVVVLPTPPFRLMVEIPWVIGVPLRLFRRSQARMLARRKIGPEARTRKRVVWGKSVSERVDLGGGGNIK